MEDKFLEKRMYFLVPYNISPIQQAIQAGHAALEYAHKYKDDPQYIDFIENWKTWIILNGGTTNSTRDVNGISQGSLNVYCDQLSENRIEHIVFFEPDLNDALTAICLIVDERVFNREDYPDFMDWMGNRAVYMSNSLGTYLMDEDKWLEEYKNFVGGEDIVFLRELLNNKKLA